MTLFFSKDDGAVTKGVVTAAASVLVYYIQRLFQQREDHYRQAAEEKNNHLEYGNKWLLVIQTVDAIQDSTKRKRQQVRIARRVPSSWEREILAPRKRGSRRRNASAMYDSE